MKKVILALAVVSFAFAACNNGETKTEAPKTDSPAVTAPDTTAKAAVVPDTTMAPKADTTKK